MVSRRRLARQGKKSISAWSYIFLVTTIFQIYRGTLSDVLIFGSIFLLLAAQRYEWVESIALPFRFSVSSRSIFIAVASGLLLYVAPRHSAVMAIWFILLIPVISIVAISHEKFGEEPDHKSAHRAEIAWSIWAVAMALAELVAYILSRVAGDIEKFPTISVLLQPELNGGFFKALFIALWMPTGIWLLAQGSGKGLK